MTTREHGDGGPVTAAPVALAQAREAFRRRDWVTARRGFGSAPADGPLAGEDQYALATAAWWLGDMETALPALKEAHHRFIEEGRIDRAVMAAIDLAFSLSLRGDDAQASGWLARVERQLAEIPEGPPHGYVAFIEFDTALECNDLSSALDAARRAGDAGRRFGDRTLAALGVLGEGRVVLRQGDVTRGLALLDEAMLAAVSDELAPDWAGCIYCHLMVACEEIGDLRRAAEWTEVTARWCEGMPGAGPFMGICRVHRAQTLHVRGEWEAAEREARHVVDELAGVDVTVVAEAHYRIGELRRQRGDLPGAEEAFRDSHALGRDPQPGLALLHLDRGRVDVAAASIRAALSGAEGNALARGPFLPAAAEILLEAGATEEARAVARELEDLAGRCDTAGYLAQSRHVDGIVRLAAGDAAGALRVLKQALGTWQGLGAVFEAARVRDALARAYEQLGDVDAASRERDAAARARHELGIGRAPADVVGGRPAGLTAREVDVLQLLADGRTNQQIAAHLVLSVRTVERHLATIYQKLGIGGRSARAAAVTFAHREGLVSSARR